MAIGRTDPAAVRGRWAVAAMFLANGFVMGAWAPQIPLLLPRHGIGEAALGLLILVLGLGAVGAMLFAGRLLARFGVHGTLRAFALALAPLLPAVVLAPSLPLLALAMALFGAIIGCMDVAMNAQAVEVERRLGRAIMSSSHGFWSLGGFAGAGLGGLMIDRTSAETHAIVAGVIAGIVVLAALPAQMPVAPAAAPVTGTRKTGLFPRDAALWFLGFLSLAAMVPEGAVLDWGALFLQQDLGASVALTGLGYAMFAGSMAVMRFLGDGVRNRYGAVRTLRISGLIGAVGMMGAALAPNAPLAILAFAVTGIGVANMVPVIFSAAGNHPGLPAGVAISVVTMVGYSGILVAPSSIGVAAEHVGFRMTFAVLSLLLVVVACMATRASGAERTTDDRAKDGGVPA